MKAAEVALAIFLLAQGEQAFPKLTAQHAPSGCISLVGAAPTVTAEGRLAVRSFAGPPNYQSVASGDAEERAFILELSRSACIDDGGNFADPSERLATVHVSATDSALLAVLRASVGREVIITGEGFASHSGHHHAPLVIIACSITVR